jgi:hypothetical protein
MRVFSLSSLSCLVAIVLASPENSVQELRQIQFQPSLRVTSGSLHNIHIEYGTPHFVGELKLGFGDCDLLEVHSSHHIIGRTEITDISRPTRFVWIVPDDAGNGDCLHAFSGPKLVGRSGPVRVGVPLRKRESISDVADTSGPWFDGVAYMKSKNNSDAFVAAAKDKSRSIAFDHRFSPTLPPVADLGLEIAIIGGGMAGLMTSLLLQSVGVENWEIMESSQRVGGYVLLQMHYFRFWVLQKLTEIQPHSNQIPERHRAR